MSKEEISNLLKIACEYLKEDDTYGDSDMDIEKLLKTAFDHLTKKAKVELENTITDDNLYGDSDKNIDSGADKPTRLLFLAKFCLEKIAEGTKIKNREAYFCSHIYMAICALFYLVDEIGSIPLYKLFLEDS